MTSIVLPTPKTVSTIGKAMKLQGCIRLEENLVVAGYVEGPLNIMGHLEVDAGGVIRGDVVADSITIAGTVIGNIRSRRGLKVLDGARVHGDIRSPSVSLSHRAQHRGNVSIVETIAERKQT